MGPRLSFKTEYRVLPYKGNTDRKKKREREKERKEESIRRMPLLMWLLLLQTRLQGSHHYRMFFVFICFFSYFSSTPRPSKRKKNKCWNRRRLRRAFPTTIAVFTRSRLYNAQLYHRKDQVETHKER